MRIHCHLCTSAWIILPRTHLAMQDFCNMAVDTLRSYKPEIIRLDDRVDNIKNDLMKLDLGFRSSQVGGGSTCRW